MDFDWEDDLEKEERLRDIKERRAKLSKAPSKATVQYDFNKKAVIGLMLPCPVCGNKFKKKISVQAFCQGKNDLMPASFTEQSTKEGPSCKDKYWNIQSKNEKYSAYTGRMRSGQ